VEEQFPSRLGRVEWIYRRSIDATISGVHISLLYRHAGVQKCLESMEPTSIQEHSSCLVDIWIFVPPGSSHHSIFHTNALLHFRVWWSVVIHSAHVANGVFFVTKFLRPVL
jgi:hypothetical protein